MGWYVLKFLNFNNCVLWFGNFGSGFYFSCTCLDGEDLVCVVGCLDKF